MFANAGPSSKPIAMLLICRCMMLLKLNSTEEVAAALIRQRCCVEKMTPLSHHCKGRQCRLFHCKGINWIYVILKSVKIVLSSIFNQSNHHYKVKIIVGNTHHKN